jgi:hypothetical protein
VANGRLRQIGEFVSRNGLTSSGSEAVLDPKLFWIRSLTLQKLDTPKRKEQYLALY